MINVAERLIGGRFEGANKHDFSDAELLHEIKEAPEPYFIQYLLPTIKHTDIIVLSHQKNIQMQTFLN